MGTKEDDIGHSIMDLSICALFSLLPISGPSRVTSVRTPGRPFYVYLQRSALPKQGRLHCPKKRLYALVNGISERPCLVVRHAEQYARSAMHDSDGFSIHTMMKPTQRRALADMIRQSGYVLDEAEGGERNILSLYFFHSSSLSLSSRHFLSAP